MFHYVSINIPSIFLFLHRRVNKQPHFTLNVILQIQTKLFFDFKQAYNPIAVPAKFTICNYSYKYLKTII